MPLKSILTNEGVTLKPGAGGQDFLDAVEKMARAMYENENRAEFTPELAYENGAPPEEPEEVISAMPKRKMQLNEVKKEPIYTWAFKSSKPRAGGQVINYVAQLEEDGTLRCNCPGWIFCKGDKACKHTRLVVPEVKEIMKKYKAGTVMETLDETSAETGFSVSAQLKAGEKPKTSNMKHGRIVEI